MSLPRYDYIIIGAGAAGLSLLLRMIDSGILEKKRLLLVEKQPKTSNDRTWCFWEQGNGYFEQVVHKEWKDLRFYDDQGPLVLDIAPYSYKMIRGIDFYKHCLSRINAHPSIDIVYGEAVLNSKPSAVATLSIDGKEVDTGNAIIFNSVFTPPSPANGGIHLLQHFKGWMIETSSPFFDAQSATLMDFRVDQKEGASFVYVLPLDSNKALVEYTLFTGRLLEPAQYDEGLKNYLDTFLQPGEYRVMEEEFGVIPMTTHPFPFLAGAGVYNIGTAGGQTKASTGYTFQFIQKQADQIVGWLKQGKDLKTLPAPPSRFHFYDSVLLHLLEKGEPPCKEVFSRLFRRNKASGVFRFLDNESQLVQEMRLMSTLQFFPFLKAALQQIF